MLVNLHHLPDVVRQHVDERASPPVVRTAFEPQLLGSAGTLVAHRDWIDGEDFFLACNADNLTDFDLAALVDSTAPATCQRRWRYFAPTNHLRVASLTSTQIRAWSASSRSLVGPSATS